MKNILAAAAIVLATMCSTEDLIPDINIGGEEDTPGKEEVKVYYDDIKIDKFSYDKVGANGGTVSPTLSYTYVEYTLKDSKVTSRVMNDGADVRYSIDTPDVVIDTLSGAVTLGLNDDAQRRKYTVNVTVTKGTASATRMADLIHNNPESERLDNVTHADTVYIPVRLGRHQCVLPLKKYESGWLEEDLDKDGPRKGRLSKEYTYISDAFDGRMTRAATRFWESKRQRGADCSSQIGSIEYVSFLGVDIPIYPSGIAEIATYKDGHKDTTFLQYATLTTTGDGTYATDWENCFTGHVNGGVYIRERPEFKPSSTVVGNVWRINNCGPHAYSDITHEITSQIGEYKSSITLRQNDNFVYDEKYFYVYVNELTGFSEIWTNRENWPEWEDYPVGSKPKWCKDHAGNNWAWPDTKSLRIGGDRWVSINIDAYLDLYYNQYKYINGTVQPRTLYKKDVPRRSPFMTDMVVRCYADVPIAGGKTRHVEHEFVWNGEYRESRTFMGNPMYPDSVYLANPQGPYLWIPRQKDAVGDFVWTLEVDITKDYPYEKNLRICNADEAANKIWKTRKWQVTDRAGQTCKEYENAKQFSGWYNAPACDICSDAAGVHTCTADYIDGKKWFHTEWMYDRIPLWALSDFWSGWTGCVWENEYEAGDCSRDIYGH